MAHVLVTGANGFVGSHLVTQLLEREHTVTAVDWMVYGRHPLAPHGDNPLFRQVRADVRSLKPDLMMGVDAVIDLAALPNEESGDLDPELTSSINYRSRRRLGLLAKGLGVKRYVLASSASVYGAASGREATETGSVDPKSVHAECTRLAEDAVLGLSDNEFAATVFRGGSAYGLSRRMRFDLVLNALTLQAFKSKKVVISGTGEEQQPLIHVRDFSRALVEAVEAPVDSVRGEIFNLSAGNYSIRQIAEKIQSTLPLNIAVDFQPGASPESDTRLNSQKIAKVLEFKPEVTPEQGIMEVFIALTTLRTYPSFTTKTAEVYKSLIAEGRLTPSQFLENIPGKRRSG